MNGRQPGGDHGQPLLRFQLLVAVTLVGVDCTSGMFRLKTNLVIKMMRYRCIGLAVKI
jgi:hypothetical protein